MEKKETVAADVLTTTKATVIAAIIAAISAVAGGTITALVTRSTEDRKSEAMVAIERYKVEESLKLEQIKQTAVADLARQEFETKLIFRAIEGSSSEEERTRNLLFFLKAGFLSDPKGKIAALSPQQFPSIGTGPSFNCATASTERESMVYGDPVLSAKDSTMAKLYWDLSRKVEGPAGRELKNQQLAWIRELERCSGQDATSCIMRLYDLRLQQLENQMKSLPN
jgi:uncharacterized protein YecT (DUF1311 family)